MAILEVKNLGKFFGTLQVLREINFSLEKGEIIVIIGASGSGKTTLLRCLNFLERPDKGSIIVNDEIIFDAENPATQKENEVRKKRLHFGLVFQNFNLFPQYTALQNVTLAAEMLAKERFDYKQNKKAILREIQDNGEKLLAQVGLTDKLNSYPHQISGGQQQRVAIARALALEPDILCFDEPTSALDPELIGEVLNVIRNLADRHTTMIIVTHEMNFARDVADRIIFMDEGIIVEQGTPQMIFENPREERTKQFLTRYSENKDFSPY
ncbi:MAG: amino acid ABC transporter ATP-binding protein [Clostridiaceae bacterium]|nr:amino acid ABC transporter ATP-binding protein [Clostridiaceae bacterium]